MDAAPGSDHGGVRDAAAGRVVVVIPTLDEEQSIADVVRGIPRAIVSRVIVADGGSRDATAARAKAAGADVIDTGPGYGRACLAATMAAEDADIVVFMDGDGADDPENIAQLVEPIHAGRYDFVIGSRARGMRELTYGWNVEMQMRAARAGLRILEIPVDYHRRRGGSSKVAGSLIGTLRAGVRIIATFARVSSETGRRRRDHSVSG